MDVAIRTQGGALRNMEAVVAEATGGRAGRGGYAIALSECPTDDSHCGFGAAAQFGGSADDLMPGNDRKRQGHVAGVHVFVAAADTAALDF